MADFTDVLVVGAGPVGLMMAAELRRHGASCRIIDRRVEPMNWVKALGVSQRTLEVWDDLGIITEALDAGLTLRRQRVFLDGETVMDADVAYPDEAPYAYPLLLPQPETERLLTRHLARFGVSVEHGIELTALEDQADGVRATLSQPDGLIQTVHCQYLVGCDGAHSTVRHALQLPFEGGAFPVEFLLADVQLDWEFPHAEACLFLELRDNHLENLLVCIPYRDRSAPGKPRYRLSTMARPVSATDWESTTPPPPSSEVATQPSLEEVQGIVAHFVKVPAVVSELRWSSVFRISHRIVPRYRVGRVFVAGDAAHIHPPTGGQGMNTGLQDAYNLAWKLALEITGRAHPDLLDSYSAERQPVGEAVVSRTKERSMNFGDRSKQDPDALREDAQLTVNYRGSAWVGESLSRPDALARAPRPGDRAPDAAGLRRAGIAFPLRLFDLLRGPHFTLILFAPPDFEIVEVVLTTLRQRYGDLVRGYRIVAADDAAPDLAGCPTLVDADGQFQRNYGPEVAAYLIRPDGYVGFRTDVLRWDTLEKHLERTFRS